jgi:hypothetical protein
MAMAGLTTAILIMAIHITAVVIGMGTTMVTGMAIGMDTMVIPLMVEDIILITAMVIQLITGQGEAEAAGQVFHVREAGVRVVHQRLLPRLLLPVAVLIFRVVQVVVVLLQPHGLPPRHVHVLLLMQGLMVGDSQLLAVRGLRQSQG